MRIKRVLSLIFSSAGYYIWLLYVCAIALALYDYRPALLTAGVSSVCLAVTLAANAVRRRNVKKFVKTLQTDMNDTEKSTVGDGLLPLAVIRSDGIIVWANKAFECVSGTSTSVDLHINEIFPDFNIQDYTSNSENKVNFIVHNDKYYEIQVTSSNNDDSKLFGKYYAVYFNDCTELYRLRQKYDEETFVSAVILVDNYDDIMQDISGSDKPKISAAIEETLNSFAQSADGVMKQYEKDKFLFYFSKKALDKFIEKKFDILDKMKEISVGNKLPPTISMGVGYGGTTMAEDDAFTYSALDMALGRGGDQVIVKNGDKYLFFGGKSQETEKRTRVKARVVAYAMRQLVSESDDIVIMGHRYADADVFGAAVGLYRAIRYLGKNCKIVMETYNKTVARILERFTDDEYNDVIINKAYANEIISKNTLVFIVDTHVKNILEEPSLLDVSKRVVVIDHHRRSTDFIQNPLISYHEPYASSTSELVSEILQYVGDGIKPKKCEAEAMYAGMYLDTKNFTFKTGVRTFEAASYLKRLGVDTVSVKKLFQIDMNTFTKKWSIMENASTYKHSVSIATCMKNDTDMQTIVAQAADEMLNITDITAAFVVCDMGGTVIISARSLGDYNVQLIMEKLGGGGHMTVAAAQLPGINNDLAVVKLKAAIDEYLTESRRN